MLNPRLGKRYAKSLLDLAIEKGQLDAVYSDILWLQRVMTGNADFRNLMRSPIIKADKKNKIIEAVAGSSISALTLAFMRLLVNKSRESNLPEVLTAFIEQYKVHNHIHTVKLTTASAINEEVRQAIVSQVRKSSGYEKIELKESVDPEIIGGFVLQMEDQLIDASVSYDLRSVARQFENNDFIYKIR